MIFWTVTGSFTAAVLYDKRQKKAVQKKWCDLVAHIAQDPLPTGQMARKITVFLSAAPGDGIGPSRQYFKEYIKPILVAAAMDYDVIEGRKEGDVRYGTAEQIRRLRRKKGESGSITNEEDIDVVTQIELMRESRGIYPEPGRRGDLVLGRHTWKEYVRGVHEGWLGPLDEPVVEEPISEPSPIHPPTEARTDDPAATLPSADDNKEEKKEEEKKPEEPAKKKPSPPPSYLQISEYSSAPLSQHIPQTLEPSVAIHQQHLLGFLKTPQRVYNFLNRRKLADDLGRETAAIILAASRPYEYQEAFASTSASNPEDSPQLSTRAPENDNNPAVVQTSQSYEQQSILQSEEYYWHKSVRKPLPEGETRERVLTNEMVLDPRIAQRMRRFQITADEEERANRIASGEEKSKFIPIVDLEKAEVTVGDVDNA